MTIEQYLEQQNLTPKQIQERFPDLGSSMKDYFAIKEMGGDEYQAELNKLGNELIAKLKEKEQTPEILPEAAESKIKPEDVEIEMPIVHPVGQIPMPVRSETRSEKIGEAEFPSVEHFEKLQQEEIEQALDKAKETKTEFELPEIPEIEIEVGDIAEIEREITQTKESERAQGYYIKGAELTSDIWMKILALGGFDYRYYRTKAGLDVFYWLGELGWLITTNNPFEVHSMNIFIFSDNSENLEKLYALVQNKIISFESKEVAKKIGTENLTLGIDSDSSEPVTQIPYKLVDESVEDIWKIGSIEELKELVNLSMKKYGCGCGAI